MKSVLFSPDGKSLISGSDDNKVRVWNVVDPRKPELLGDLLLGIDYRLISVAISPDGSWLVTGSGDSKIHLWDISDPANPVLMGLPLTGHNDTVTSVAFSPDDQWLASGSADHTLILWDFRLASWQSLACQITGRNLTQVEWQQYLPGQPYRKTCPQWEAGK
jgi:WD40 repeat protein